MKKDNECCGTCKWHHPDDTFPADWICVNGESENCGDYTEYEESCDHWEERGTRCRG